MSLINGETSFVCLRKCRTFWTVSMKSVRLHIFGNKVESSQNAFPQLAFTCSKFTIETLEQGVKFVQS